MFCSTSPNACCPGVGLPIFSSFKLSSWILFEFCFLLPFPCPFSLWGWGTESANTGQGFSFSYFILQIFLWEKNTHWTKEVNAWQRCQCYRRSAQLFRSWALNCLFYQPCECPWYIWILNMKFKCLVQFIYPSVAAIFNGWAQILIFMINLLQIMHLYAYVCMHAQMHVHMLMCMLHTGTCFTNH